jgi:hypothetical protein
MTEAAEHAAPRLRREPAERAARALLPACAGVWTAAEIMSAVHAPWLDIGLGAAVLAALAGLKGARNAAKGVLFAGAWTAAAVRLGPLADPALYYPLTWGWAALTFCGWRYARSHPSVVAARDRREAAAEFLGKRDRWGLQRAHLLDSEKTRLGHWFLADIRGTGKRASAIVHSDVAERIAEDLMLPVSRVQVKAHRLAGRIEVSIRETDPWAHPIAHPVLAAEPEIDLSGPCTCREPFVIGQDPETGRPLTLTVWDEDGGKRILLVATSRAGKTVLLNCLRERGTKARDVLVVDLNLSKALEDKEWAPACHLTAITRHQAARALRILRLLGAVIEWRSQQPRATAVFQPSPEHPLILLIGDEIDALSRMPAAKELLRDIFSKGGSEGVAPVIAGQRGTAEWIGGGDVRALVDVFALSQVNRRGEAMHAAGDIGLEMPDMARYGDGRKGVWAIAELGGEMQTGRSFLLKEPHDLRKLAEERALYQPDLEPELKTFLGKSYENLLSTEPFATWARDQQEPRPVVAHPRPDATPEPMPTGAEPGRAAVPVLADDNLTALDEELDAAVPDDLRHRWLKQGEKLAETRRVLEEASKADLPDIPHDHLVAHAEAQWRALGEATEIPDDALEPLLRLLAAGTTIREVAETLSVSKWIARTYLERLRTEGRVRIEGEKRTARWLLNEPAEGDAS